MDEQASDQTSTNDAPVTIAFALPRSSYAHLQEVLGRRGVRMDDLLRDLLERFVPRATFDDPGSTTAEIVDGPV